MNNTSWLPWVLFACILLGGMSGLRSVFSGIKTDVLLFVVGVTWLPCFSFLVFRDFPIYTKLTVVCGYTMVAAISLSVISTNIGIGNWQLFWLVICGLMSAAGNYALFQSVSLASPNAGFPLAVFSLQSVAALFVSFLFIAGGTYAIKLAGSELFWLHVKSLNFYHWLGILLGILCVISFNLADMK